MKKLGFTLVEIIVALGLLGLITVVGTQVVLQTIQSSNRTRITNDARQEGEKIMQDVGREIRKAACIEYNEQLVGGTSYISLYTFSDKTCATQPLATFSSTIDHINAVFNFTKTVGGSASILTPNTIAPCGTKACELDCKDSAFLAVNGLRVTALGLGAPSGTSWQWAGPVRVELTLQQAPGQTRIDYCGYATLSETFTPRNSLQ